MRVVQNQCSPLAAWTLLRIPVIFGSHCIFDLSICNDQCELCTRWEKSKLNGITKSYSLAPSKTFNPRVSSIYQQVNESNNSTMMHFSHKLMEWYLSTVLTDYMGNSFLVLIGGRWYDSLKVLALCEFELGNKIYEKQPC